MSDMDCMKIQTCLAQKWPRALAAVVGMAHQDGRGPVYLFKKHDTHHLVRPGRRAECHPHMGHAPQFRRKSVGAADQENSLGGLVVPPAPQKSRKSVAVEIVATLVERDSYGFGRDRRRNRRGFFRHARGGIAGAAFGNLLNLKAAESELAADVVEALAI